MGWIFTPAIRRHFTLFHLVAVCLCVAEIALSIIMIAMGTAYKYVIAQELVEWQDDKFIECVLNLQKNNFKFLMVLAFALLLLSMLGIATYGKFNRSMVMVHLCLCVMEFPAFLFGVELIPLEAFVECYADFDSSGSSDSSADIGHITNGVSRSIKYLQIVIMVFLSTSALLGVICYSRTPDINNYVPISKSENKSEYGTEETPKEKTVHEVAEIYIKNNSIINNNKNAQKDKKPGTAQHYQSQL